MSVASISAGHVIITVLVYGSEPRHLTTTTHSHQRRAKTLARPHLGTSAITAAAFTTGNPLFPVSFLYSTWWSCIPCHQPIYMSGEMVPKTVRNYGLIRYGTTIIKLFTYFFFLRCVAPSPSPNPINGDSMKSCPFLLRNLNRLTVFFHKTTKKQALTRFW